MKKQFLLDFWIAEMIILVFLFAPGTAFAQLSQLKGFEYSLPSGEGFWEDNLPPSAQKAWQSTVKVRCIQIQMFETEKIKKKVKVGAGIIIDLDPERQVALIVNNNHCIKRQKNLLYQYEVRIPLKPNKETKKKSIF